jgi:hypothetical protein
MDMDMMKSLFPTVPASGIDEQPPSIPGGIFGRELDEHMDNQLERRKAH